MCLVKTARMRKYLSSWFPLVSTRTMREKLIVWIKTGFATNFNIYILYVILTWGIDPTVLILIRSCCFLEFINKLFSFFTIFFVFLTCLLGPIQARRSFKGKQLHSILAFPHYRKCRGLLFFCFVQAIKVSTIWFKDMHWEKPLVLFLFRAKWE